MTHFERFNLRKSYTPDLSIGQELDRTQKEIDFGLKDWRDNSGDWDSVKVAEWISIMKEKKEYLQFLKQLFDHNAKS